MEASNPLPAAICPRLAVSRPTRRPRWYLRCFQKRRWSGSAPSARAFNISQNSSYEDPKNPRKKASYRMEPRRHGHRDGGATNGRPRNQRGPEGRHDQHHGPRR